MRFTFKFPVLTYHFGGGNIPEIQVRKLDPKAFFVVTPGFTAGFEYFFLDGYASVKTMACMYQDCANMQSGFYHIGLHWVVLKKRKHMLMAGLGPTYIYRANWNKFTSLGYYDDGFYNENAKWQYRWIWYGAEIDYYYKLNKVTELTISAVPDIPSLLMFSVGVRLRMQD